MVKIKNINDYYDKMYELYPDIPQKDIQRILKYFWKQIYLINSYGGDVQIDRSLWCFFGFMHTDSIRHFQQYVKKICNKLRILFKRKHVQWDGYYYFALTDSQYENMISKVKPKSRKNKVLDFGNQVLYKIYDECSVKRHFCKYIYRIPIGVDLGFAIYKPNFRSNKAELVTTREKLKFKDILVTNYKYQFL